MSARRRAPPPRHRRVERRAGQHRAARDGWVGRRADADGAASAFPRPELDLRRRGDEGEIGARADLVEADADAPLHTGKRTAARHALADVVTIGPTKKSRAAIVVLPFSRCAPGVERHRNQRQFRGRIGIGERAADGAARPCRGWPMKGTARASSGTSPTHRARSRIAAWSRRWRRRLLPGYRRAPAMRLMSISRVGRASRITIIGTSVCPPAIRARCRRQRARRRPRRAYQV